MSATRSRLDQVALRRTSDTWQLATLTSFEHVATVAGRPPARPELVVVINLSAPGTTASLLYAEYVLEHDRLTDLIMEAIFTAGGATPSRLELDEHLLRHAAPLDVLQIVAALSRSSVFVGSRADWHAHALQADFELEHLPRARAAHRYPGALSPAANLDRLNQELRHYLAARRLTTELIR